MEKYFFVYVLPMILVFLDGENGKVIFLISSAYVVPIILVFLDGENGMVLLWNFLEHPRDTKISIPKILRVWPSF